MVYGVVYGIKIEVDENVSAPKIYHLKHIVDGLQECLLRLMMLRIRWLESAEG